MVATIVNDDFVNLAAIEHLWDEHEESRVRCAVSRAYYAAFRVMKARLLTARAEWRSNPSAFPQASIHKKVREAIENTLSSTDQLAIDFKSLLRKRNSADYAFHPTLYPDDADGDIGVASDVIARIESLDSATISAIAFEVLRLDSLS